RRMSCEARKPCVATPPNLIWGPELVAGLYICLSFLEFDHKVVAFKRGAACMQCCELPGQKDVPAKHSHSDDEIFPISRNVDFIFRDERKAHSDCISSDGVLVDGQRGVRQRYRGRTADTVQVLGKCFQVWRAVY